MAKEKSSETEELKKQLQRALADYANLARRSEEEKQLVVKFANVVLIAKFLEVLDSLEAAQKVIQSEGLELVIQKLRTIFASEAVKEVELGEEFDPAKAEAVESVAGEEDGKILEVVEKGYELNGKLIRPARVRVSKKAENKTTETAQEGQNG
ncbi:MAG: nucleotide exchange factor GrpE [bacterium]|nr:nucleotide exchange factor GrpE [bacterium]